MLLKSKKGIYIKIWGKQWQMSLPLFTSWTVGRYDILSLPANTFHSNSVWGVPEPKFCPWTIGKQRESLTLPNFWSMAEQGKIAELNAGRPSFAPHRKPWSDCRRGCEKFPYWTLVQNCIEPESGGDQFPTLDKFWKKTLIQPTFNLGHRYQQKKLSSGGKADYQNVDRTHAYLQSTYCISFVFMTILNYRYY